MKIEPGKSYITAHGAIVTIAGEVRGQPEWCWSTQGDWYERATGKRLTYREVEAGVWRHIPHQGTWSHLVREVPA